MCLVIWVNVQSLSGHTSAVESVTFDAAEVVVVAGAASGTIKLWDLEEAKSKLTVLWQTYSYEVLEIYQPPNIQ
jgi:WD40 repeat protein